MPRSILVADPSVTIRRVVELTFSDSDFYVETTCSGRDVLARVERLRPDVVLLDVALAAPSAYEICRAVKSSPWTASVLLLVGTFEQFDEQRGTDCGADGHLVKPFESRLLLQRVERLLGPRPPGPERPAPVLEVGARTVTSSSAPSREEVERLARAVIERMAEPLLRDLARTLLPDIAERVVRERIRELEREESG